MMEKIVIRRGDKFLVEETLTCRYLKIEEGAQLLAPGEQQLVMTVNGHAMYVAPGQYEGEVVLTTMSPHMVRYRSNGTDGDYSFISAVFVEDGKVQKEKSVLAAVRGGTLQNGVAENVKISADMDGFGGFYITGKSVFQIRNSEIRLKGTGGNDFIGLGAGVTTNGNAHVLLDGCVIENEGLTRSALVALGHSCVEVKNTSISVRNGNGAQPGGVPWMLGLTGKVRATNLLEHASVRYKNCHIKAQGWGCMSTDATDVVNLEMENCLVETTDSGYGCYSIGYSNATFRGCEFRTAAIGTIMAVEGNAVFTGGTKVSGGRFGIMMHHLGASGTLLVAENSEIHGGETAIQIKGRGGYIVVENSTLSCGENGLLIHSVNEDDPMAIGGPGPTLIPNENGELEELAPMSEGSDNNEERCLGEGPANHEILVSLSDTDLKGTILHTRVHKGNMVIQMYRSVLWGAISTGVSEHCGPPASPEYPQGIGCFQNTLCQQEEAYGLKVFLDPGSKWTVTETSYLDELELAEGAVISAPSGRELKLYINGEETPISAGMYEGKLVLKVC